MRKIVSVLLSGLFALSLFSGCIPEETPTVERNDNYRLGVCEKFYDYNNLMEKSLSIDYVSSVVQTMGMKSYRLGLSYATLFSVNSKNEPVFKEGALEVAHKIVDSLVAHGVERICVITDTHLEPYGYYANTNWAVPDPLTESDYYLEFLKLYEKASAMLAREFPQVQYFEPGNEPDHETGRPISKNGYTLGGSSMVNANFIYSKTDIAHIVSDICWYVSRGVKSVNPDNQVVTPGMCNGQETVEFLGEIYAAIESRALPTGEKYADVDPDNYFQILSWHPYLKGSSMPEMDDSWVQFNLDMHEVAKAHDDGEKLVWFTEVGFTDRGNEDTEELNAERVVKMFNYIEKELPFVETAFMFRITDLASAPVSAAEDHFGMFRSLDDADSAIAGQPKPIAYALYKYFHGNDADTSVLQQWMNKK